MCTQSAPNYHSFIVMKEIGQANVKIRTLRVTERQMISEKDHG